PGAGHGAGDPLAGRARRPTVTRHEIDAGLLLPADRPLHMVILGCARIDGQLAIDPTIYPGATLSLA
ncbi:MAG: hypothetical protein JWN61_200, partial [Pseudonocardiales bacterium]|nr:hypothetical protein [Pseudonocardiales bacterium]